MPSNSIFQGLLAQKVPDPNKIFLREDARRLVAVDLIINKKIIERNPVFFHKFDQEGHEEGMGQKDEVEHYMSGSCNEKSVK